MSSKLYHKRLNDFEWADRIELAVVPRYKTSGLSGDEWRTGVQIRFFFKGEEVHTRFVTSMKGAIGLLFGIWDEAACPIPQRVIEIEKTACDQPSCPKQAVGRFLLKRETASNGEYLDPKELHLAHYRKFCRKHLRRGDCSREDADSNYTPLDAVGPDASTNIDESPSATMVVSAEDLGIDLSDIVSSEKPS